MLLSVRLSLVYASMCLFMGVYLPFFPVWLKAQNLTAEQISLVIAATLFPRILSQPFFAFLADRWEDRRRVVLLLSASSLVTMALLSFMSGFWAIFFLALLMMSLYPACAPLVESIAMRATREQGLDYGRVRLWCSLTFIGSSAATGWLLEFSPATVIAFCLIGALAVHFTGMSLLPRDIKEDGPRATGWAQMGAAVRFAGNPLFLLFLFAGSLAQATHAVYYTFGTLNWQAQGLGDNVIGILWGVGVVAEIVLFLFSNRVVEWVGITRLLALSGLAAMVRWSALAFDPPVALLFPLQALHGLTFGAAHLAAMHFIVRAAPVRLASTAQSLYSALAAGAGMGLATLGAGPVYETLGSKAYLVMAGLGALSCAGALVLGWRWDGNELVNPDRNADKK